MSEIAQVGTLAAGGRALESAGGGAMKGETTERAELEVERDGGRAVLVQDKLATGGPRLVHELESEGRSQGGSASHRDEGGRAALSEESIRGRT